MKTDLEQIALLERINYLTVEPIAAVTPGLEVILQETVIFTSSQIYPSPDANHACLIRTDAANVDGLIDEIVAYFTARKMPPAVLVSPACQPTNLPERLLAHGFQRQELDETWLVMDDLQKRKAPKFDQKVEVRAIGREQAPLFAQVMVAAYEMPLEYTDALAELIAPSIGVPGITHFLAFMDEKPVCTLSLMRYQDYVTLGSAGVLPEYRRGLPIFGMAVEVLLEAQRQGVQVVLGQTSLGPLFERFLRMFGFKYAFKRVTYMLTE